MALGSWDNAKEYANDIFEVNSLHDDIPILNAYCLVLNNLHTNFTGLKLRFSRMGRLEFMFKRGRRSKLDEQFCRLTYYSERGKKRIL